jgi:hypothetical protein
MNAPNASPIGASGAHSMANGRPCPTERLAPGRLAALRPDQYRQFLTLSRNQSDTSLTTSHRIGLRGQLPAYLLGCDDSLPFTRLNRGRGNRGRKDTHSVGPNGRKNTSVSVASGEGLSGRSLIACGPRPLRARPAAPRRPTSRPSGQAAARCDRRTR